MARIFVHDEFGPEALAMMQALYSRSPESVESHIKRVHETGSANFMKSYYVGYGHASIGDCGTTTLFFEGVSILAAKAIQDNPLYSGQETSTRYIDFSKQPLIDPVATEDSKKILDNWIDFYVRATDEIRSHLESKFPCNGDISRKIWKKAINSRGFDILRGFLPAGATTQLSWSTNLRQAYDKLSLLKFHPLEEVRAIAIHALGKLGEKYPSSFSHVAASEVEGYYQSFARDIHYSDYQHQFISDEDFSFATSIDNAVLEQYAYDIISSRPKGARLPRYLSKFGRCHCIFLLDYGSFRDVQRHRNGLCRMPILTANHGFNQWYLSQLPSALKLTANKLLADQYDRIVKLASQHGLSDVDVQYYLPMGNNVICELVYDLPEMVYVTELRSNSTVHPTLRKIALQMHKALSINYPTLKLYADITHDVFDVKRGAQDIEKIDII